MFERQQITALHRAKQKFLKELLGIIGKTSYDHFTSRVKRDDSVATKLRNKGYAPTPGNACDHLSDLIGIRIVTLYISDIYDIVNTIRQHFDIKEECDYVASPKASGYRSYHVIVTVPVDIGEFHWDDHVDVEIQIRTKGMDFWASLEHSLIYNTKTQPTENNLNLVSNELLSYAESVFSIDMRMQALKEISLHR